MNHFHTISLPPPPSVPPPPPPPPPVITSNQQILQETESIKTNQVEKLKNNPPLPPRPK